MACFNHLISMLWHKISNAIMVQFYRITSPAYFKLAALIMFMFFFTFYIDIVALIWPNLLAYFQEIPLFVITVTFINVSIHIFYSTLMYLIYTHKFPFFEQFRISKEPWPWETDSQKWRKLVNKTILNFILNILIIAPVLVYRDCQRSFSIKMKLQDAPPSKFTYVWQFFFFLVCNQIWSYFMHVLMHQPLLYWIHKAHHQFSIPVSISGLYVHPLQYIVSSAVSTSLGYKTVLYFYPVHVFSLIIWLTFRNIEINDSHSGYNWPWAVSSIIPFSTTENYHYFHHRVNTGNFSGILCFMDNLFETNAEYWKYEGKLLNLRGNEKTAQKNLILYGYSA